MGTRVTVAALLIACVFSHAGAATITTCGYFFSGGECHSFQPFDRQGSLGVAEVPEGVETFQAVLVTGETRKESGCHSDSMLVVASIEECEITDFGCGELLPNPDMECQVWRGPDVVLWVNSLSGFAPGDSVRVTGIPFPACATVCLGWPFGQCVWEPRLEACSADTVSPVVSRTWGRLKSSWEQDGLVR